MNSSTWEYMNGELLVRTWYHFNALAQRISECGEIQNIILTHS